MEKIKENDLYIIFKYPPYLFLKLLFFFVIPSETDEGFWG